METETKTDTDTKTKTESKSDTKTEPESQKSFDAEYVKGLREEAAKYRTQAKESANKAKKFDEAEEASKSDLEKAQTATAEAEAALEKANLKALRAQVGAKEKLPPSMISRLQGTTEEEMTEDAKAILADLENEYVAKAKPGKQDTGAGVAGEPSDHDSMSPVELAKEIRTARGR